MSHTITHRDKQKSSCKCNEPVAPSKLDLLIAKYKTLIAEATAAKNKFVEASLSILNFQFEEATEEDIYAMFEEDENTNA